MGFSELAAASVEATKWLGDRHGGCPRRCGRWPGLHRRWWSCSAASFISIFASCSQASLPCPFFAHGGVAFDGDCGAARQTGFAGLPRAPGAVRQTSMHRPPDPRRARKPTSGAVVPLNRVRTGGGRGASVPRPPGAGVPGWFGPGRRLGPPVALRQPSGSLGGRRGGEFRPRCGPVSKRPFSRAVRSSGTSTAAGAGTSGEAAITHP